MMAGEIDRPGVVMPHVNSWTVDELRQCRDVRDAPEGTVVAIDYLQLVRPVDSAAAELHALASRAALGMTVQRARAVSREAIAVARAPVMVMVVALGVGLAVWLRPWREDTNVTAGKLVAPGASAVIARGEFVPRWLRVASGECAVVRNDSEATYGFAAGSGETVGPGETAELCADDGIVHRVRLTVDGRQIGHSGGFLITDSKP